MCVTLCARTRHSMTLQRDSLLMVQPNLAISKTHAKQNWFTIARFHYIGTFIEANQVNGKCNGLFQKISTPPYGRHWIGYLKISGFPRRTTSVFAVFLSPLIQNLEEFQNFAKIWMVVVEFQLKFTKFRGNLWISSHTHWAFLTGFPMSSMGGVWIFSGIAQYILI